VKSAALPATFPGAFTQHRWPLFRGVSKELIPTAIVSGGASVPVKQVAPDDAGTAYARVDFPTRVRVSVSSEQSGLSELHASLLRSVDGAISEDAEYMYVNFSGGVAELWLGPGPAILKVSNGGVVLHSETVSVPETGCLELSVPLAQGRARFEFGEIMQEVSKGVGSPSWQVEIWRTDGWEELFTVDEPCVIATSSGRYRAYVDHPCVRAEVAFDVETGREVTILLDAQLFAAGHVDIEHPPDGLQVFQCLKLCVRAEDQLSNNIGWDGAPLTTTWTEGAFRLHGLPRGRACWVWGNADDWFLKPIRVMADDSKQMVAATWLRLSPVPEEWRLIDGATYIQIPGTPVVQPLYFGLPLGEVRVIYQAADGRRLTFDVQVEDGRPSPIPSGLRQALERDGRLLDKPPLPPPEEAPTY
jgi:hypothetical protein